VKESGKKYVGVVHKLCRLKIGNFWITTWMWPLAVRTGFLVGTFFAVSYSKMALVVFLRAIETGMILSIMDIKKQLLCIFFIDLYSPRFATIVLWILVKNFGV
jgi:hypothetical protein